MNSFPVKVVEKQINKLISNFFQPKLPTFDVPKCILYHSFPYLGPMLSPLLSKELTKVTSTFYPFLDLKVIFSNPNTIGTLFKYKDCLPDRMRANIIYKYTCPRCTLGSYVGSTQRRFQARISAHRGVSYRTGQSLGSKEHSAPRTHSESCKTKLNEKDFKILASTNNKTHLLTLESLYIKQMQPSLNANQTSVPLFIA